MGEAKRRGTKEERTAQAIARNEATKAEAKQTFIAKTKSNQGRSYGIKRLPFGLAIALATLGTSAFEVGKNEN
jgi:cytochrome c-type biogenesis protein CcmH/NrfG